MKLLRVPANIRLREPSAMMHGMLHLQATPL